MGLGGALIPESSPGQALAFPREGEREGEKEPGEPPSQSSPQNTRDAYQTLAIEEGGESQVRTTEVSVQPDTQVQGHQLGGYPSY